MVKGHIKKRAENSFAVIIDLPKNPGEKKRNQKWYTVHGSLANAEAFLQNVLVQLNGGVGVDWMNLTFGQYLKRWLEDWCDELSPNTRSGYQRNIDKHIIPKLGAIKLRELSAWQIKRFYIECAKTGRLDGKGGLAGRTILQFHRIIHSALERARKLELVTKNVCSNVDSPRQSRYRADILSFAEVEHLISTASNSPGYISYMLGVLMGMRRGEVLGLTWNDVDLTPQAETLHITQTLTVVDRKLQFVKPKSDTSYRVLAIPQLLVEPLKQLRREQAEHRLRLGEDYYDHDLVVCRTDGRPINPGSFSQDFRKWLTAMGIKHVRFHDLRHTHASLLSHLGAQPKLISERLGHSTIGITMDLYAHVMQGADREAARKLDAALKKPAVSKMLAKKRKKPA